MALTYVVLSDISQLEQHCTEWQALLKRSATNEVSLTPVWQLTWWRVFGRTGGRELKVVLVFDQKRLVGIAPFLSRRYCYRPGVRFRRLELIASGEDECDEICSDYIGIIAERGAEYQVARMFAQALMAGALGGWDELVMPAMPGEHIGWVLLQDALREHGVHVSVESTSVAPYASLPSSWDSYLELIPSSRRQFLRRSIRDFEKWAGNSLRIELATSHADLEQGKQILIQLHQRRWSRDGRPGVFSSKQFMTFQDTVMPALLDAGALRLMWIFAHNKPIAALYNIVWNGKASHYQSGRSMDLPPNVRVGIVTHAYAIQSAIESGLREYDFLSGASRYKLEFALATRSLVQLRATRHSLVETLRQASEAALEGARAVRANWLRNPLRGAKPDSEQRRLLAFRGIFLYDRPKKTLAMNAGHIRQNFKH